MEKLIKRILKEEETNKKIENSIQKIGIIKTLKFIGLDTLSAGLNLAPIDLLKKYLIGQHFTCDNYIDDSIRFGEYNFTFTVTKINSYQYFNQECYDFFIKIIDGTVTLANNETYDIFSSELNEFNNNYDNEITDEVTQIFNNFISEIIEDPDCFGISHYPFNPWELS